MDASQNQSNSTVVKFRLPVVSNIRRYHPVEKYQLFSVRKQATQPHRPVDVFGKVENRPNARYACRMKRKRIEPPITLADVAVFYDMACDKPDWTFAQVTKRLLPKGFGNTTPSLKREAKKMYDLARK
jgi:hypothetical protein